MSLEMKIYFKIGLCKNVVCEFRHGVDCVFLYFMYSNFSSVDSTWYHATLTDLAVTFKLLWCIALFLNMPLHNALAYIKSGKLVTDGTQCKFSVVLSWYSVCKAKTYLQVQVGIFTC